jgi:hypothetical protein
MLKEGLITTHPLSNCENIIEFEAGQLKHWKKTTFNYKNNTFYIYFDCIINENELEYLFHIYSNLGYYLSYYKVYNSLDMDKDFPWIDINQYKIDTNNKKNVTLFFESKFDEKLKYTPKKLYHVTPSDNQYKINKKGLMPLYFEKGDFRPDRIHLSLSKKESDKILKNNIFKDKTNNKNIDYITYEIETDKINNLVLYQDPKSNGVYTYNHINPNFLKIIE